MGTELKYIAHCGQERVNNKSFVKPPADCRYNNRVSSVRRTQMPMAHDTRRKHDRHRTKFRANAGHKAKFRANALIQIFIGGLCIILGGFSMSPILNAGVWRHQFLSLYAGILFSVAACQSFATSLNSSKRMCVIGMGVAIVICAAAAGSAYMEYNVTKVEKSVVDTLYGISRRRRFMSNYEASYITHGTLFILSCVECLAALHFFTCCLTALCCNDDKENMLKEWLQSRESNEPKKILYQRM